MTYGEAGNGMRLIRACVVAGAASLLIGVPAASAAPSLTIKPKNRVVLYGAKSTKIVGHLSGASPQKVELQRKPYPYTGAFKHLSTKRTDSNGNYSFTVKPDRNTQYRVALVSDPTITSGTRFIYVNGLTKWKLKFKKGSRTIRVSFTFTFSPQLDTSLFAGVPLRWYFRVQGGKFHRVKTTKTKRVSEGTIAGNLKYTYPNSVGKRKYYVQWCFQPKQKGDVGVGEPGKAFKKCT
jgi:hypothetical protein